MFPKKYFKTKEEMLIALNFEKRKKKPMFTAISCKCGNPYTMAAILSGTYYINCVDCV